MADANAGIRVLALSVRRRRIGYVVFEGSTQLLDWGVRSCVGRVDAPETATRKRIAGLLKFCLPSVVVLGKVGAGQEDDGKARIVLLAIKKECAQRSIASSYLNHQTIIGFFVDQGCRTKYEIAQTLAAWFPELAWNLPPKRKPWESEKHSAAIFEAAAIGTVYFQSRASSAYRSHRNE